MFGMVHSILGFDLEFVTGCADAATSIGQRQAKNGSGVNFRFPACSISVCQAATSECRLLYSNRALTDKCFSAALPIALASTRVKIERHARILCHRVCSWTTPKQNVCLTIGSLATPPSFSKRKASGGMSSIGSMRRGKQFTTYDFSLHPPAVNFSVSGRLWHRWQDFPLNNRLLEFHKRSAHRLNMTNKENLNGE